MILSLQLSYSLTLLRLRTAQQLKLLRDRLVPHLRSLLARSADRAAGVGFLLRAAAEHRLVSARRPQHDVCDADAGSSRAEGAKTQRPAKALERLAADQRADGEACGCGGCA